ncbi:sensor domain-containing diguanylate cyclase [Pseudescherichia sp.]|uniref:sensor domain-containing diguanylate cyclase n=1 Tax=Pseudescherichia sp. TaxID=2055881 RepID=UPI00289F7584|nr:sensor domain-containing diguanylate cyclase [Pseudescherichia sp.]
MLATPIWIVAPESEELIFANQQAQSLSKDGTLASMRSGEFSAVAHRRLTGYAASLKNRDDIIEVWSLPADDGTRTLSCKLSAVELDDRGEVIVFEGLTPRGNTGLKASSSAAYRPRKNGFYARFFYTTSAPIVLVDPAREGQIVDANLAALRFYGYTYETLCTMHIWQINTLGRNVLPIVGEIAHLPGGHKPLSFTHRLANGSTRDVQVAVGPVEIYGERLILCVVHDMSEQRDLEQALESAERRDPLTRLFNRCEAVQQLERQLPAANDFSLLLVNIDRFRNINQRYGHKKGDEVLIYLAQALSDWRQHLVFRWDGEEFLLLLPDTALAAALTAAEDLRAEVEKMAIPDIPPLTVSVGVAQYLAGESLDSLFQRVDEGLYQAKNRGRNSVFAA